MRNIEEKTVILQENDDLVQNQPETNNVDDTLYISKKKDKKTKSDDILSQMPVTIKEYSMYLRHIKGLAPKTVNEYCYDLRTFFRFMKRFRGLVPENVDLKEINVSNIDFDFIKSVSRYDIFEFMNYVIDSRNNIVSSRHRKTSALKGFFTYLTVHEKLLKENPTESLSVPKAEKPLPKFLTLEQSLELLQAVDGDNKERDYCMLTLFLNCGIRLSELVGIDFAHIIKSNNTLRVLGKGSKERIVYLNSACLDAIDEYVNVRPKDKVKEKNALFLSSRLTRISPKTVQYIVKSYLQKIGLGSYSVHKLRHTAATLMYQNNVDIRTLQDVLGHENLGTTQIYTHVSNEQTKQAFNSNPLASIKPK